MEENASTNEPDKQRILNFNNYDNVSDFIRICRWLL